MKKILWNREFPKDVYLEYIPRKAITHVWCLCQREDSGYYIVGDAKKPGCLEFYHPRCVGLSHIISKDDSDM